MNNIVNDFKDISKDVPGPDVGVGTNDHEDLENDDKETEMIETAINRSKCGQLGAHDLNHHKFTLWTSSGCQSCICVDRLSGKTKQGYAHLGKIFENLFLDLY